DVTEPAGRLAGAAEAAAVLESLGIGDERARTMGRSNVFQLAADVAEEQDRSAAARTARRDVEAERRRSRSAAHPADTNRPVLRGIELAVPVVAALGAIPALTASLWNHGQAGIERATAIAVAAATSLPV